MKNRTTPYCLLLVYAGLFSFLPATAQTKVGLKKLREKNFTESKPYFQKDWEHPTYACVARYGFATAIFFENESQNELLRANRLLNQADSLWSKLPYKKTRKLTKLKVKRSDITSVQKQVQLAALERVSESGSVPMLDTFLAFVPRPAPGLRDTIDNVRRSIVNGNLNSEDYDVLTSIIRNHSRFLRDQLQQTRLIEVRLFNAFWDKYGPCEMERFAKDHPKHWAIYDCWWREMSAAMCESGTEKLIGFWQTYPWSILEPYIVDEINERDRRHPDAALRNDLVLLSKNLKTMRDTVAFRDSLYNYIKRLAPRRSAYDLTHNGLQFFLGSREYRHATELMEMAQPYFPDTRPPGCTANFTLYNTKQQFFENALVILRKPAEGIEKMPLTPLNTYSGDEFSPVFSASGRTMYFGSNRQAKGNKGEDVYSAVWDGQNWSVPRPVPRLSGPGNQAPLSLTADGNQMLVFVNSQLCISQQSDTGWTTPVPIPDMIGVFPWVGKAVFSADGKDLLFEASADNNMLDENRNIDLYAIHLMPNGKWSKPVSLGPVVNTAKKERTPYLALDGKTLYFSSEGHPGLGDFDVFVTRRLGNSWTAWSTPENLGKEINDTYDNWSFTNVTANGKSGFVGLSHEWGFNADLWQIGMPVRLAPDAMAVIEVRLKGVRSGSRPATVVFEWISDSTKEVRQTIAGPDSMATMVAPVGTIVKYRVEGPDILPAYREFDLTKYVGSAVVRDSVALSNINDLVSGHRPYPLQTCRFAYKSAELPAEAHTELDELARIARDNRWKIHIVGHTDDTGSPKFNEELSLGRADAVLVYLTGECKYKVPAKYATVEGKGAGQPKCPNDTEEGKQCNRRVEVFVERVK